MVASIYDIVDTFPTAIGTCCAKLYNPLAYRRLYEASTLERRDYLHRSRDSGGVWASNKTR